MAGHMQPHAWTLPRCIKRRTCSMVKNFSSGGCHWPRHWCRKCVSPQLCGILLPQSHCQRAAHTKRPAAFIEFHTSIASGQVSRCGAEVQSRLEATTTAVIVKPDMDHFTLRQQLADINRRGPHNRCRQLSFQQNSQSAVAHALMRCAQPGLPAAPTLCDVSVDQQQPCVDGVAATFQVNRSEAGDF